MKISNMEIGTLPATPEAPVSFHVSLLKVMFNAFNRDESLEKAYMGAVEKRGATLIPKPTSTVRLHTEPLQGDLYKALLKAMYAAFQKRQSVEQAHDIVVECYGFQLVHAATLNPFESPAAPGDPA